jgi:hypothetical protein
MAAFLSALTGIANQAGEAKTSADQDKFERAEKMKSMDIRQAQLDLDRQAGQRQQKMLEQNLRAGKYLDMNLPMTSEGGVRYKQFYNTEKGAFEKVPIGKTGDPLAGLKQVMGLLNPEQQTMVQSAYESTLQSSGGDEAKASEKAEALVERLAGKNEDTKLSEDKWNKEQAEREKESGRAREENREFRKEENDKMRSFQKMMVDFRLDEKQKYMTPVERQTYDAIKQVDPAVQRTIDFLEKTKDSNGKPLNEENAYVFGDRSALMQHLRFRGYKFGKAQEDISQQLIKNAALIQVLGARPWMTMGRGKFIYETITQHLPSPTDTPKNMYDKLTWLRDNVLEDARDSLAGYVQPGGSTQGKGSGTHEDPIVIP